MNTEITSAEHVNTIKSAIENLVKEYTHLHGRMTKAACSRRTQAMDRLTATTFAIINDDLDAFNEDNLSPQLAEEVLECSRFSTDLLASVLLDIDGTMRSQGPLDDGHEPWTVRFLLETWLMFLEQLKATGDDDEPAAPSEGNEGDQDGQLAA